MDAGQSFRARTESMNASRERTFDDAKMDLTQTICQQGHFNKDVQRRFGRLLIDRRHLERDSGEFYFFTKSTGSQTTRQERFGE